MAELTEEQIRIEWERADSDKSGTLSFKEMVSLIKKLNMKVKEKDAKKIFKLVDEDGSGAIDYDEFKEFLAMIRTRPEVSHLFEVIYEKYHENDDDDLNLPVDEKSLTAQDLLQFLKDYQYQDGATIEDAEAIIDKFEHKKKKSDTKKKGKLTVRGFNSYLSSLEVNSVFNPEHAKVYQDMDQPFAHYFIDSSHNTYLLGDQLKGESSVEAYINAFKKGCRCVELDCWDGEDINQPIIYHGHTLTTKILFRDVIQGIKDYGFMVTDYPVILSLEVHCSVEGQKKMAEIIKEILGDMLPETPEDTGVLPSPSKLLGKVILKGKRISAKKGEEEDEDSEEEPEDAEAMKKALEEMEKEGKPEAEVVKGTSPNDHPTLSKELSDLIHLKTGKVGDFKANKAKGPCPWLMCSFSETKVNKILAKNAADFLDYNNTQLSRIYPKGIRFDSSNYDPVPSWNCGSQIVALNYQTGTEPMWVNNGKFLGNGNCGYILKPEYMRGPSINFDPSKPGDVKKTLKVEVISGFQFPKSGGNENKDKGNVVDPYVKIIMSGVPADTKEKRTKTVKNNGFNPNFHSSLEFGVRCPELAILQFVVMDEDKFTYDNFLAQYVINVEDVREGYRLVPLKDKKGNTYDKASLLVRFKFTEGEKKEDPTEAFEGKLLKKSKWNWQAKWSPRHYTISNGELKYYLTKQHVPRSVRGALSVRGVVFQPISSAETNFAWAFMCATKQKIWFMKGENAHEVKQWKRHLLEHGAKWDPTPSDAFSITKEGKIAKIAPQ